MQFHQKCLKLPKHFLECNHPMSNYKFMILGAAHIITPIILSFILHIKYKRVLVPVDVRPCRPVWLSLPDNPPPPGVRPLLHSVHNVAILQGEVWWTTSWCIFSDACLLYNYWQTHWNKLVTHHNGEMTVSIVMPFVSLQDLATQDIVLYSTYVSMKLL